ncbi:MAG: hypothetical protein ABIJ46_05400 [bacterium]
MKTIDKLVDWCGDPKRQKILGWFTLSFSMAMALFGLPNEVWTTYQEQQCTVVWPFLLILTGVYIFRLPYNTGKKAWASVPSDAINIVLCTILITQKLTYE